MRIERWEEDEKESILPYIAPADAGIFDLNEDIIWIFDLWYRPVLEFDLVDAFQHEREVLLSARRTITSVSGGFVVGGGQGRRHGQGGRRYLFNLCDLGGGSHIFLCFSLAFSCFLLLFLLLFLPALSVYVVCKNVCNPVMTADAIL